MNNIIKYNYTIYYNYTICFNYTVIQFIQVRLLLVNVLLYASIIERYTCNV